MHLSAAASRPVVPDELQPVLALLTQGLNVHSTRLDALARAVTRLERGALQQAEAADAARAEAERRASQAFMRAEEAEARSLAAQRAAEERAVAAEAVLERRVEELEARLEAMPPALDELRSRTSQLDLARGTHERELSVLGAQIAEGREAHASLGARVDACATASALAAAEATTHAADAQLREEIAEGGARTRQLTMQCNALAEAHSQLHNLCSEQQAALSALQTASMDAAAEAESTRAQVRDLATAQGQLETAQARVPIAQMPRAAAAQPRLRSRRCAPCARPICARRPACRPRVCCPHVPPARRLNATCLVASRLARCHHLGLPPPRAATTSRCHHLALPPPRAAATSRCRHLALPPPGGAGLLRALAGPRDRHRPARAGARCRLCRGHAR